jgi:hypothetical protein
MVKRTKTLVAGGALVLILGGAGAGIAAAQTTTPAAPSTSTPAAPHAGKHHAGKHHAGLRGVEHGELTVHTKAGDKVVDVQRGTVTAVDATSVTVTSVGGFSATYTLDPATKVHKDKKAAAVGDVAVHDRVQLQATKTATSTTANHIGDSGPGK